MLSRGIGATGVVDDNDSLGSTRFGVCILFDRIQQVEAADGEAGLYGGKRGGDAKSTASLSVAVRLQIARTIATKIVHLTC